MQGRVLQPFQESRRLKRVILEDSSRESSWNIWMVVHAVWLASLNSLRLHGKRVDVTAEAAHMKMPDASDVTHGTGCVLALVSISLELYSQMQPLNPGERLQRQFWQTLIGQELLDGEMFVIRVKQVEKLAVNMPLQQHTSHVYRGLLISLEHEQSEQLMTSLPAGRGGFQETRLPVWRSGFHCSSRSVVWIKNGMRYCCPTCRCEAAREPVR